MSLNNIDPSTGRPYMTRGTAPTARATSQPDYSLRKVLSGGIELPVRGNTPEWEISQNIRKELGLAGGSDVFIPFNQLTRFASKRDLSAGTFSAGGALIENKVKPTIQDALIPHSALANAGMTIIKGLRSGLVWPRWATPSSPSGLAENTTVIASTAETLSALELVNPSRFSVQIKMSNQWTKQTDFNAEAAVVHEINRAIGSAVDFVCINGTSGLLNLSQNTGDASTVTQNLAYLGAGQTFGGAPTWQTIQALKKTVLANNTTDEGDLSYLVSPSTYNVWATTAKGTGSSFFLIEDNKVGPDRVVVSNNLSSTHQVLFGKFNKAVLGIFGVSIVSDTYTQMPANIILTVNLLYSFGVLAGPSIVRSEDAANQ